MDNNGSDVGVLAHCLRCYQRRKERVRDFRNNGMAGQKSQSMNLNEPCFFRCLH